MPNTNLCERKQKITNFTTKINKNKNPDKNLLKRPISPFSSSSNERDSKRQIKENNLDLPTMSTYKPSSDNLHSLESVEENALLK